MTIIPEQMDPMDSVLMMVFVISIASGMVHPEEIDWDAIWRAPRMILRFAYTWLYRSAQALCQNAGKINPQLGLIATHDTAKFDAGGRLSSAESIKLSIPNAAQPQKEETKP